MTGIELIFEERLEQLTKHGWTLENDMKYTNGELIEAAHYALHLHGWPSSWDVKYKEKIAKKSYMERLAIAGALIAAEMDRLNNLAE